jgi:hypothetical protein
MITQMLIEQVSDLLYANLPDEPTYAQVDAEFWRRLVALELPQEQTDEIYGSWLWLTDHEKPSKMRPRTRSQLALLASAMARMVGH